MNLNNRSSGKAKADPIAVGPHMVRIVHMLDFGVQENDPYQGEEKPPCNKLNISFEFPTERTEYKGVDKPRWLGKTFNVFTGRGWETSGLKKVMDQLDPDGSITDNCNNVENLLGTAAMVIVGRTSGGNAKITTVTASPTQPAKLENPPLFFDFENPDKAVFDQLLDWQQKEIRNALNFSDIAGVIGGTAPTPKPAPAKSDEYDDSPF